MKNKTFYMVVTNDSYELPLCVGEGKIVAAYAGITLNSLYTSISRGRSFGYSKYKIVKVNEMEVE